MCCIFVLRKRKVRARPKDLRVGFATAMFFEFAKWIKIAYNQLTTTCYYHGPT